MVEAFKPCKPLLLCCERALGKTSELKQLACGNLGLAVVTGQKLCKCLFIHTHTHKYIHIYIYMTAINSENKLLKNCSRHTKKLFKIQNKEYIHYTAIEI